MGSQLSKPVTDKISSDESNDLLNCGTSCVQGSRYYQEDRHNCILDYDKEASFFAVYDGHNGGEVATYASEKLPDLIKQSEAYKAGDYEKALIETILNFDSTLIKPEVVEVLKKIRLKERYGSIYGTEERRLEWEQKLKDEVADIMMKEEWCNPYPSEWESELQDTLDSEERERIHFRINYANRLKREKALNNPLTDMGRFLNDYDNEPGLASGCTAIVALVTRNKIFVANVGDSRCIISKKGKVVEMSIDHKPYGKELERVEKAGGEGNCGDVYVFYGSNNASLGMSRSLGDHLFKRVPDLPPEKQILSPLPDVKVLDIDPDVEFMFLSCDGIYESHYVDSERVAAFIRPKLIEGVKPSKICEQLLDECLGLGTGDYGTSNDNMTAILVQFKNSNLFSSKKRKVDETEA